MIARVKWGAVCIAAMLLLIIILGITVKIQSSSKAVIAEQNRHLTQERDSAQAVTNNVIKATSLFNDIAQATHEANKQSDAESDQRVVIIRQSVKDDSCAKLPVPAVATGELRAHADKLRNGAAGSNPSKPDR